MSVLSSLVTQLVIPAVSTNVVSGIKKRAAAEQAGIIADILEERITDYLQSFRSKIRRPVVLYYGRSRKEAEAIAKKYEENTKAALSVGSVGIRSALSLVKFLVRYPEVDAGSITHKELVCDLFESVSDIVPLLRSMNLNEEVIGMAEMGIEQVTSLVADDKSKEAADMVFLGIKELLSLPIVTEVFSER